MPDTTTPSPPAPTTPPLGGTPLPDAQRTKAFVAGLQRDLNRFLSVLGAPTRLAVDGEWDDFTEAAFRDVCRILGIAPDRNARTFRLIAGASAEPTPEELSKRATDGAAFATALKARFAQERVAGKVGGLGGVPLGADEAKRAFVASLQRDLNVHLRRLHTGMELAVDGEWDEFTDLAFKQVCKVLGIAPELSTRTFRIIAGAAAARTPEELAKARKQGATFAAALKAAGVPPRVVMGGHSLPKARREEAYIAFVQRTLNDHLVRLGSPAILAVDGAWGKDTQRSFDQICRVLGIKNERGMRAYRIIAGALAARTEAEVALAASAGAAFEQQLRADFAHQAATMPRPKPKPQPPHVKPVKPVHHDPQPAPAPVSSENKRIAAAIRAHGGRYEAEILAASRATGVPIALLCAMLEQESSFRNIYGHDKKFTRNPIRSPDGGVLAVTRENYAKYLHFRNRDVPHNQQGVGPMQLTFGAFQDRADKLGGCFIPKHNIQIGAEVIRDCIRAAGGDLTRGLIRYNGGSDYPGVILPKMRKWEGFLGTKGPAVGSVGVASSAKTFAALSNDFDPEVQAFQRLINHRFAFWKIRFRLDEDGKFGKDTRDAGREMAAAMGLARVDFIDGFTPKVRRVLAHPDERTAAQKARAKRRSEYRAKLRAKYAKRAPAKPVAHASVAKLLGGHQAPKSAALMKVIEKAGTFGLIVTATTDGTHALRSFHKVGLAVDFGVPASLAGSDEHTRRLKAFQTAMLKEKTHLLELYGPIRASGVRNGQQILIEEKLWKQHLNHVHVAAN